MRSWHVRVNWDIDVQAESEFEALLAADRVFNIMNYGYAVEGDEDIPPGPKPSVHPQNKFSKAE